MTDKPEKCEYVSVRAICERFGLHKSTIHRLLRDGKIRGKKLNRKTMVELQSVIDYVASLPDR